MASSPSIEASDVVRGKPSVVTELNLNPDAPPLEPANGLITFFDFRCLETLMLRTV